jgi:5-hydroxyisourate hydrolase-like protein (transthyretin family)
VNGNTPAKAVAAWRRVHGLFREEGATNVAFVWSPNAESVPIRSDNAIAKYWPGDAYVDIMALDGFNWGVDSRVSWGMWKSFETVFQKPYSEMTKLSKKPLIVAETGTTHKGGDKKAWITDMFNVIPKKFPRIVGIVWMEANLARDWRIGTSSANMSAFKTGLQGSTWTNKSTPTPKVKASKKKLKKNKKVTLSGSMTKGKKGDKIRLEVKKPGSKKWTLLKTRTLNSKKKWSSYKYKLGKRGTYSFRVRYTTGDYTRRTATSKTVKVVVR